MADIILSQVEADALIAMEKHRVDDEEREFPGPGAKASVPLVSPDKRENFILDVTRGQINLLKATFQNRARQAIILVRLDLAGPPHRNPDGEEIPCPHLHLYREGYGDKWASAAPKERYPTPEALYPTFEAFMAHCNITMRPLFQPGLF